MPKLVSVGLGLALTPELGPLNAMEPPYEIQTGIRDPVVCQMLRFLVHFVLFLRTVEPCMQVTESYVFLYFTVLITELGFWSQTSHRQLRLHRQCVCAVWGVLCL